ncbi:MAG: hypothetical protein ACOC0F_03345, partial [archaeon]
MTGTVGASGGERAADGDRTEQGECTDDASELVHRVGDLEDHVAALRRDLATVADRDLPLLKGTVRAMTGEDVDAVDDLPDAGRALRRRIDRLEERLDSVERRLDRLGDVGQEATSKEEKFAAILAFAENKRNGSPKVAVTPQEIKGCTAVSRRYAYELI